VIISVESAIYVPVILKEDIFLVKEDN